MASEFCLRALDKVIGYAQVRSYSRYGSVQVTKKFPRG
ncbi:hypothetical protein NHE_0512 [Neorickettsia helminthoeca str. Oregon]|uniref:Uncharacterized protein n=1 Tax=Neorickettsia helminthoeca str. Oregon TaxID=1286528 RepID=X5H444_9RICK|nr:hypothetical protein NHE_0512 [Neorickettsia helminthoeca str. Oregon]